MGIKDLFWIDGSETDVIINNKNDVSKLHESSNSYDIEDTFSKKMPIELNAFNNQLKLLRLAITDDVQLMNVVMINLKQNYPDITKDKLLSLFKQCFDNLAVIETDTIIGNSSRLDLEISKTSAELDDICNEIGELEQKITVLESSKSDVSLVLTNKKNEKLAIIAEIKSDSSTLQSLINKSITLINKI